MVERPELVRHPKRLARRYRHYYQRGYSTAETKATKTLFGIVSQEKGEFDGKYKRYNLRLE